jgi:hypothetical protein
MNKKNILFLDIDGVLNSWDNAHAYMAVSEKTRDIITKDNYGSLFDERCVRWLRYIILMTKADIVISSTWKLKGLFVIQEMWKKRCLPGNVIDITTLEIKDELLMKYPDQIENQRGYEIEQWIEEHREEILNYCIIDDNSDMLNHQIDNFAQVDIRYGLNRKGAENVLEIFKIKS